jgi:PAS domain S-box-containing protein
MNGKPIAEHIGQRVGNLFPELFMTIEPYVEKALQGESVAGLEVRYPRSAPDGGLRTMLLSYEPARDEANEVIGVSVAVVDITERKEAEEALQKSEDHYRRTVELNPHIPWSATSDFMEIEISPRWMTLTGTEQDEINDHGWLDVVHPGDVERTQEAVLACIETGEVLDVELRVRRTDGTWIWMRSRGSALRDATGKILRWYGSMEDIDDSKREKQEMLDRIFALERQIEALENTRHSVGRLLP